MSDWQEKVQDYAQRGAHAFETFTDTPDTSPMYDTTDVHQNRAMALLSYISFLVFVPIIAAKDSPYARFHANQGLCLFIVEAIWWLARKVVQWAIGWISWPLASFITGIMGIVNIVFMVFAVIGILNVLRGKAKELPIIGGFRILR